MIRRKRFHVLFERVDFNLEVYVFEERVVNDVVDRANRVNSVQRLLNTQ